jgi:hypothetical protein
MDSMNPTSAIPAATTTNLPKSFTAQPLALHAGSPLGISPTTYGEWWWVLEAEEEEEEEEFAHIAIAAAVVAWAAAVALSPVDVAGAISASAAACFLA